MYLAIDIGGTKTLIAQMSEDGDIKNSVKFPTPKAYADFLKDLDKNVKGLGEQDYQYAVVAVPGVLDRKSGMLVSLGNLSWQQEHIVRDVEKITDCPIAIENDAKLAGLSEAQPYVSTDKKVLYITISTGIGIALINDGIIDNAIGDTGGHDMYVEFGGKRITWEQLASGKSIVETYGKRASEIDDPETWEVITRKIAVGLIGLIAILQPDRIIIGGGVGTHFSKYEQQLKNALSSYKTPMTQMPEIVQAKHPEEAVLYGCYELAKQHKR